MWLGQFARRLGELRGPGLLQPTLSGRPPWRWGVLGEALVFPCF